LLEKGLKTLFQKGLKLCSKNSPNVFRKEAETLFEKGLKTLFQKGFKLCSKNGPNFFRKEAESLLEKGQKICSKNPNLIWHRLEKTLLSDQERRPHAAKTN
jgi:hypothetical protein